MTRHSWRKANRYGTPMYVYDGDELKDHYDRITSWLHQSAEVFFSFKSMEIFRLHPCYGLLKAGIEVASV